MARSSANSSGDGVGEGRCVVVYTNAAETFRVVRPAGEHYNYYPMFLERGNLWRYFCVVQGTERQRFSSLTDAIFFLFIEELKIRYRRSSSADRGCMQVEESEHRERGKRAAYSWVRRELRGDDGCRTRLQRLVEQLGVLIDKCDSLLENELPPDQVWYHKERQSVFLQLRDDIKALLRQEDLAGPFLMNRSEEDALTYDAVPAVDLSIADSPVIPSRFCDLPVATMRTIGGGYILLHDPPAFAEVVTEEELRVMRARYLIRSKYYALYIDQFPYFERDTILHHFFRGSLYQPPERLLRDLRSGWRSHLQSVLSAPRPDRYTVEGCIREIKNLLSSGGEKRQGGTDTASAG